MADEKTDKAVDVLMKKGNMGRALLVSSIYGVTLPDALDVVKKDPNIDKTIREGVEQLESYSVFEERANKALASLNNNPELKREAMGTLMRKKGVSKPTLSKKPEQQTVQEAAIGVVNRLDQCGTSITHGLPSEEHTNTPSTNQPNGIETAYPIEQIDVNSGVQSQR